MDLFSRKVISWNTSAKPDVNLVMTASKKLMTKETSLPDLCFILIEDLSILPFPFGSFWILLMICNHFQRKDILLIMLALNVSSNISKRKKQIENLITLYRNYSYPSSNILKDTTAQEDHMALLEC